MLYVCRCCVQWPMCSRACPEESWCFNPRASLYILGQTWCCMYKVVFSDFGSCSIADSCAQSDLPTVLLNTTSSLFWRSSCVPYIAGSWMLLAAVDSLCSCSTYWLLSPSVFFLFYCLHFTCFSGFVLFVFLCFRICSFPSPAETILWKAIPKSLVIKQ